MAYARWYSAVPDCACACGMRNTEAFPCVMTGLTQTPLLTGYRKLWAKAIIIRNEILITEKRTDNYYIYTPCDTKKTRIHDNNSLKDKAVLVVNRLG